MYLRKGIGYPLKRRVMLDRGVDGLSELRHRKPAGQKVLLAVRARPRLDVSHVRSGKRPR
jgi:hypothetical protein